MDGVKIRTKINNNNKFSVQGRKLECDIITNEKNIIK